MPDEPRDAREAPPWRPEAGPAPEVTVFLPGHRPLLRVRIGGVWRQAVVRARHDYPPGKHPNTGRTAYQVDVRLPARPATPTTPAPWKPTAGRTGGTRQRCGP